MTEKQFSLTELKKQFGAWQVPNEEHFHALINLAALTFKPGLGLSGGDPSMNADVIDAGLVTRLQVKAHDGMTAIAENITVLADPAGGLEVKDGSLTLKPSSGVMSEGEGISLQVNAGNALKVGESVAVQIKKNAGLICDEKTGVSLQIDNKTVAIDDSNRLRVKCAHTGGLTIDKDGHLGIDIDIIFERPCIRAYQGRAYVYIPKSMMSDGDRVFIYRHNTYLGEINSNGGLPVGVGLEDVEEPNCSYIIKKIKPWVTENDELLARLIKKEQGKTEGEEIARYKVTQAGLNKRVDEYGVIGANPIGS